MVKQSASKIGVDINIKAVDQNTYYSNYWLTGEMSLVDYGHRGVPNVFLNATLTSKGSWNAAHFKNAEYDNLFKQYAATVDITAAAHDRRQDRDAAARSRPRSSSRTSSTS